MTFIDFISKQIQIPSKSDRTRKLTKKNRSKKLEEQTSNPSIIKSSEFSRCLSKKTVTFASVFDVDERTERTDDLLTFDLTYNDASEQPEELATVIINRFVEEKPNVNTESYPFRSETALSTLIETQSPTSFHSGKKSRKHFLRSRPAKKLRYPVKTVKPIETTHRSTSAPDLLVTTPINSNQPTLKTVRQWFKCSSLGRFVRSITKTSATSGNQLPINSIPPATNQSKQRRRKYSDLIY